MVCLVLNLVRCPGNGVCVCMCICVYMCVCVCVHTSGALVLVCVYVYMCVCVCVCVCGCFVFVCTLAYLLPQPSCVGFDWSMIYIYKKNQREVNRTHPHRHPG